MRFCHILLYGPDGRSVGHATVELDAFPAVVLWNDRAFSLSGTYPAQQPGQLVTGLYKQTSSLEIPREEVRK